ncbi:acyl-CoA dehydrogenase family protein [Blastococcus tunisiensis]|uniref:Acyl-CoA dehydrogenase n=1 Tax=Blastococcus tunisiensis TaxID=1798228 RepID=A0A1I2MH30_9ACTN|nr:acyl-CoA dehydrogenase family protein [Blastococcus sp. DSM 46838]SFF90835.1 Acyl-CoA dehydrogenase [Blastococcus sp. DSM 46838]
MTQLNDEERAIVATVRQFVEREVAPVVDELEHANTYPGALIERMKVLGVYGLLVPEEFGGLGVSTACFAAVTEELARGWMSLAGAMGGHGVVVNLLSRFGTDEQRHRYLPALATGELRATMALTEPDGGSDLQSMRTVARADGDDYVVTGTKMWITNARRAGLVALLCKTDPGATPPHRGMSILLVEQGPGMTVSRDLSKLGYKGVETCEISFDDCRVPGARVLGGAVGAGFTQMMTGLELGRIQVAARATGVARAAFEASLAYSQQRVSFGVPIWQHQSIGNYLADMAVKLEAARMLVFAAADRLDGGARCDLEAGMAKLYASEVCLELCQQAVRIHASNGYSTEYPVERFYRDAPLMVVGEGTNEIQRSVIARQLVERGGLPYS